MGKVFVIDFENKMEMLNFDCPVCLELMKAPVSLACGHNFCSKCLRSVYIRKPNCPVCRRTIFSSRFKVNCLLEYIINHTSSIPFKKNTEILKFPSKINLKNLWLSLALIIFTILLKRKFTNLEIFQFFCICASKMLLKIISRAI